ncbi:hypothetical protein EEB11_03100 [Pseudotabrizicola sediminis]|uniref:Calcium-binding protein n=1 Tax=Pseudotabrizicola sediminis TaxID=2486418 RepID=A0ABY2KQY3_9RHOB|nr:hypothetical protein EEB11_03100 [Pseudotabrizicola sediminis]
MELPVELLLLLPLLLVGGLVFGGGNDDDDSPPDEAEEVQAGTSGPDLLLGDSGADLIHGLEGDDVLHGDAGPDRLNGGVGNDILLGGAGDDVLSGSLGRDMLIGGAGNDLLYGGFGADVLIGSSGSDSLLGGEGADTLIGLEYDLIAEELSEVADEIEALVRDSGLPAADLIAARIGEGVISGNPAERGPDVLDGGAGNDVLIGDDGDTLTGGEGVDEFVIAWRDGEDASLITDFDHQTETLTLLLADPDAATILIQADGPTDSVLLVNGEAVVRLAGQTAAALAVNPSAWLFRAEI